MGPIPARELGIAALTAGAEIIMAEAKSRCPESKEDEPHLRDSMAIEPLATDEDGSCTVLLGFDEPAARHAGFVEFGTAKMKAEPFMRPALDSAGEAAIDAIVSALQAGIDEAAKQSTEPSLIDVLAVL